MHFRSEAKHSTIQKTLANRKTNSAESTTEIEYSTKEIGGEKAAKSHTKNSQNTAEVFLEKQ